MPRLSFAPFTVLTVRIAAAALGISLLLTGCQGGSSPGSPPSETGSTTASPTPGASGSVAPAVPSGSAKPSGVYKPADAKGKAQNVPVPVMPELAKENTKEGLEAFIRYWFTLLSYAYETGDVSGAKALADSGCILCSDLFAGVATNYSDGRWLVGGTYQTPVIEVLWQTSATSQAAKVQVLQKEILYMNPDGSNGRELTPATNDAAAVFVVFRNDAWLTTDLGVIR